jgi:hypothetical protein
MGSKQQAAKSSTCKALSKGPKSTLIKCVCVCVCVFAEVPTPLKALFTLDQWIFENSNFKVLTCFFKHLQYLFPQKQKVISFENKNDDVHALNCFG